MMTGSTAIMVRTTTSARCARCALAIGPAGSRNESIMTLSGSSPLVRHPWRKSRLSTRAEKALTFSDAAGPAVALARNRRAVRRDQEIGDLSVCGGRVFAVQLGYGDADRIAGVAIRENGRISVGPAQAFREEYPLFVSGCGTGHSSAKAG